MGRRTTPHSVGRRGEQNSRGWGRGVRIPSILLSWGNGGPELTYLGLGEENHPRSGVGDEEVNIVPLSVGPRTSLPEVLGVG